jgi:hypothetical protein
MGQRADWRRQRRSSRLRQFRPCLEVLEDRVRPTVYTVTNATDATGPAVGNAGSLEPAVARLLGKEPAPPK